LHRQKLGPWASIATAIISFCIQLAGPIIGMTVAARSLYLIPNSSANPSAKFRARPAETVMPWAMACLNSARVALPSLATARARFSQKGQSKQP
jgi:hypothetical protein